MKDEYTFRFQVQEVEEACDEFHSRDVTVLAHILNDKKRLGQKCFSLGKTRTNLFPSRQICSGLLFISDTFDFSYFQRLIGVQDEDSCGKSSLCETPQACRGGSRATRGKRSLERKSLTVLRTYTSIVRLYIVAF